MRLLPGAPATLLNRETVNPEPDPGLNVDNRTVTLSSVMVAPLVKEVATSAPTRPETLLSSKTEVSVSVSLPRLETLAAAGADEMQVSESAARARARQLTSERRRA